MFFKNYHERSESAEFTKWTHNTASFLWFSPEGQKGAICLLLVTYWSSCTQLCWPQVTIHISSLLPKVIKAACTRAWSWTELSCLTIHPIDTGIRILHVPGTSAFRTIPTFQPAQFKYCTLDQTQIFVWLGWIYPANSVRRSQTSPRGTAHYGFAGVCYKLFCTGEHRFPAKVRKESHGTC